MSRLAERLWCGLRVGKCLYRFGAVVCAYSGGAAFEFVDRYCERRSEKAGVVVHLVRQFKLVAAAYCYRCAQNSSSVAEHEVYFFFGNEFCRRYEVSFVFPVWVVDYDYELSFAEVFYGFFDCCRFEILGCCHYAVV